MAKDERGYNDAEKEILIRVSERKRAVGKILAAYGAAIERGDKLTAEVLDALATEVEQG